MPYRLAFDTDPENPNPHAWELGLGRYAIEAEARAAGDERDAEEVREYGNTYGSWIVVYDPIPRGGL